MPENNGRSPNRRSFMKTVGGVSLGAVALSSTVATKPGDKANSDIEEDDSLEERIRKSDPQDLYEFYAEQYSPAVAEKVQKAWTRYTQAILKGKMSEEVAEKKAFNALKSASPELRQDIEAAQREVAKIGSNAAASAQPTSELSTNASSDGFATMDSGYSGEILRIDGNVGGSGVGFRDSNYYVSQDILTSIVETVVIGSLTQWSEFTGNFYIGDGEGGTYRATAEYWHNGMLLGGDASYDMWISPRGTSGKTFFNIREPGSSVYGNESRSVQMTLSDDTVYDFGFRLTTAINGLTDALVDYQTINADGSTRQVRLDSLTLNQI